MFSKFKEWLIEREGDHIEQAVLGVVAGSDPAYSQEEKDHLLARSTDEFGEDILERLRSLGVVRNQEPGKLYDIQSAIKNGIKIRDLINLLRGENLAPNAAIQGST
jgi:hypothetical protein